MTYKMIYFICIFYIGTADSWHTEARFYAYSDKLNPKQVGRSVGADYCTDFGYFLPMI